jgi:hypothetical protein
MDLQPIGPTRRYVIVCYDGRRIDLDAESMWPSGSSRRDGPCCPAGDDSNWSPEAGRLNQ